MLMFKLVLVRLYGITSPLCFMWLACLFATTNCQSQAPLDPNELRALNVMFSRWNISSFQSLIRWNVSGNVCSAGALEDYRTYDAPGFNPGILCDCSFNGGIICHITRLKARELGLSGNFPEELATLKYLDNLDLAKNYLSGPLPAFIGNFSAMKYLSIGKNLLSGTIPKELGSLQNLISLGIDTNNFSGSLPPELGNMTSLKQIYLDNLGLTGEIPQSISNLYKLEFMFLSNTDFVGKIPDFLGNMSNLKSLRMLGNSLQGPIPSSFANLSMLSDLQIGDLIDGRSSLEFVANMKSLRILILRNSQITATIPLRLQELNLLMHLDLSFNNLTGTLPPFLFNLGKLQTLFIGNNSLSGSVPDVKISSLTNIDLSYNQLSGSLPAWVDDSNVHLNLVGNNFSTKDFSNIASSQGLSCLQRSFPCNRDSPIYYSFAINCGGAEVITSSGGIVYEDDSQDLSTASYYISGGTRWAVSSVGIFMDASNPNYTENIASTIRNTEDVKLYESARLSPSSLRYYGLGLENGNYTVTLHFAETAFPDEATWMSLGVRIFDIYIQGNLVAKEFNIRKEAGGVSFTALERKYVVSVTDNFLEIHFFWAGKGTCCVPSQGYYGPRISGINVFPNFKPTVRNRPPKSASSKRKHTALIVGFISGLSSLGCLATLGAYIWKKKLSRDGNTDGSDTIANSFSYSALRSATDGFNPTNKLGEGGFGAVYKGKLSDGRLAAVKQLSETSLQGKRQFVTEVATISAVQHRNLVKLYGCCYEKENTLLVYEYLENKSLDQALFGKSELHLDWPTRFGICLGTARGLSYLHEESRLKIVHRDVKASNILLDSDLNPKLSDFGLARLCDDQRTHISTRVAGTIGYLAPEYAMRGHLTDKVDVFAFGILALEIVSGKQNSESTMGEEKMYLLEWAWHLHEKNAVLEMVDPSLSSFDKEEVTRVIAVALLCTQAFTSLRPAMSRVVSMLLGDTDIDEATSKPAYLSDWKFDDDTIT